MRILHTADLHIGQILYQNYSRQDEHLHFLNQLEQWIQTYSPDALVVSGDVFDIQQPGVQVRTFFNDYFAELHKRFPRLVTVMTAGNHDSPSRLHADRTLWRPHNVHVVALPPPYDLASAPEGWEESFIVGLDSGYIVALPFMAGERTAQIQAILDHVAAQNSDGKPVVMMAHAAVTDMDCEGHDFHGQIKTTDAEKMGTGYDYLALGHIHKPQTIGHPEDQRSEAVSYPSGVIRYSGSALHVSCDERYPHSVSLVDIDRHGGNVSIQQLIIDELRHFHILPSATTAYHSLKETLQGLQKFIDEGGKGYFRLHIDHDADIPTDFNQTIYNMIEHDSELRFNPKTIWSGQAEEGSAVDAAPAFQIADLQQMTDPMYFIEKTIDRYHGLTLEQLKAAFEEVQTQVGKELDT